MLDSNGFTTLCRIRFVRSEQILDNPCNSRIVSSMFSLFKLVKFFLLLGVASFFFSSLQNCYLHNLHIEKPSIAFWCQTSAHKTGFGQFVSRLSGNLFLLQFVMVCLFSSLRRGKTDINFCPRVSELAFTSHV